MKKVVITRKEFIMTKTLLLSLMLMIVIGCNRASNNKNDFACFEDKKVFVKYSNTIEGYDVKIMVSLDTLHTPRPYRALIDFSKNGETVVQILHPDFFLPEEKRSQYEENSIIIANYNTPTIEEKGIVRLEAFDDVPFFFLDVDFDGKKELLLNHFGMGQRGENAFEVIDFETNDYYGNLEYRKEPFTSFDSLTEIDYDNKTITNTGIISGGCEWWISKFRKTDVGFAETIEQHEIQYDKNSVGVEMMRIVTPDSLKSDWTIAPPDKRILQNWDIQGEWHPVNCNNHTLYIRFENGKYFVPYDKESNYTYKISSDSLIIENQGWGRQTFRILKLTQNNLEMVLIRQEIFEENIDEEVKDDEIRYYYKE